MFKHELIQEQNNQYYKSKKLTYKQLFFFDYVHL